MNLMKLLKRFSAIIDRTIGWLAFLSGAILIYILISVTTEVIMRNLRHPTTWVIEFAAYGLVFITFLPSAWIQRDDEHAKLEILVNRLNRRAQALIDFITSVLGTIICLVIGWYAIEVTWQHFQKGYFVPTFVAPPMAPLLAPIPIGVILLLIQFVRRSLRYLREWRAAAKKE